MKYYIFFICLLLVSVGSGCRPSSAQPQPQPQPQDFFSKKMSCAKELKSLQIESKKSAETLGSIPAQHEVCYSKDLDTCLDFEFYSIGVRPFIAVAIVTDLMSGARIWDESIKVDYKADQYITGEQILELRGGLELQKIVLGCVN